MVRALLLMLALWSQAITCAVQLVPGSVAPAFSVPTLEGRLHFDPTSQRTGPLLFYAYNSQDAFSNAMWTTDAYLDDFLLNATQSSEYVFLSYSEDVARMEVLEMRERLVARMKALAFSGASIQHWLARLHFVPVPVSSLSNTWIPDLLAQWNSTIYQLHVTTSTGFTFDDKRLDARYDWLPYVFLTFTSDQELEVAWFGDGCGGQPVNNVAGKLALISRSPYGPECDWFTKVNNAQQANATGVIIYSDQSQPLIDMNCQNNAECNTQLNIPATMITYQAGLSLRALLADPKSQVTVRFTNVTVPGFYSVIDQQALIQELGWLKMPTLMHYAWASQWYEYYTEMLGRLRSYDLRLPIAQNIVNNNSYTARVKLPSRNTILRQWTDLTLDLALSCLGTRDEDCPIWDRLYAMQVCCDGTPEELCNKEIGRWITPFRRRVGRWLTPSQSLISLITYSPTADYDEPYYCSFSFGTGTSEQWVSTINLLANQKRPEDQSPPVLLAIDIDGEEAEQGAAGVAPTHLQYLYSGGAWNVNYTYQPIQFQPPNGTVKTELVTIITGHGNDANGCGEFCNIVHTFVINQKYNHSQSNPQAGTPLGCANEVRAGSIPNEHGTWLYGRGGWCDGMEVDPYVADITSQVVYGRPNQISYYATFDGQPPHHTGGGIDMASYLVFWTAV